MIEQIIKEDEVLDHINKLDSDLRDKILSGLDLTDTDAFMFFTAQDYYGFLMKAAQEGDSGITMIKSTDGIELTEFVISISDKVPDLKNYIDSIMIKQNNN